MTALTRDDPKVRFSNDSMKAFLYLPRPDFEGYNLDDITEILRQSGISYGIK